MSLLFAAVSKEVRALQGAYQSPIVDRRPNVIAAQQALLTRCLELEVRALSLSAVDPQWTEDTTAAAAGFVRMAELASRFDPSYTFSEAKARTAWLVVAASLFYRAGRQGSAASVLRRLKIDGGSALAPNADQLLVHLTTSWMAGGAIEAAQQSVRVNQFIRELVRTDTDIRPSGEALTSLLSVVEFSQALVQLGALLSDDQDSWPAVREAMQRANALARVNSSPEMKLILAVVERSLPFLERHSVWNLTKRWWQSSPPEYAVQWSKRRVQSGRAFLFPGQRDALIDQALLDKSPSLASMPTGAGKSLLAEVFAMRKLAEDRNALILVVVPTRALANEKRDELESGLAWPGSWVKVTQLTGEVTLDDEEIVSSHHVIVATPEKADAMLRNGLFAQRAPAGLVVDEFHQVRKGSRGFRLQTTMKRFQHQFPSMSILLISAIVREQDFQALAEWVGSPQPFESDWRPTPVRAGIVDVTQAGSLVVEFNDGTTREVPALAEKRRRNNTTERRRWVSHEFAKEDQVLQFETTWRVPFRDDENKLINEATAFASEGFKLPEYCDSKKHAELLAAYTRLAGPKDPLVEAFAKGIAVHWGDLPLQARKIVEEGIRKKAVGLVLTTSTLAEGVNLPVRTVFVPRLGTTRRPMEKGLYLNVVGRAGRPFFHSEGQVVIGFESYGRNKQTATREVAEEYRSASRAQVEPLRSALAELGEAIEFAWEAGYWEKGAPIIRANWAEWFPSMSVADQGGRDQVNRLLYEVETFSTVCLSILVEHELPDITGPAFDALALIGTESSEDRSRIEVAIGLIRQRLLLFEAVRAHEGLLTVTDWGNLVYRVGLGPESCVLLRRYLANLGQTPEVLAQRPRMVLDPARRAESDRLLEALWVPIEFTEPMPATKFIEKYLYRAWLGGVRLADSATAISTPRRPISYIEALTRVTSRMSGQGAWVFTALAEIAKHEKRDGIAFTFQSWREASFYGAWRPDLLRILRSPKGREILRDDLLLVDKFFRPLIERESSRAEVQRTLASIQEFGLRGDVASLSEALARPDS